MTKSFIGKSKESEYLRHIFRLVKENFDESTLQMYDLRSTQLSSVEIWYQ